jgi:catechol 2,3-dioxygenase-like lactoylglutathione lyase family enzyme
MSGPQKTPPSIVAPVMQFLPVADVERSTRFYRDVLGFSVLPLVSADYGVRALGEVVRGAARIQFTPQETDAARRVLFLESGDVDAEHARLRQAAPSAIERVNWIKMRMFEVRDPDGHVLWFGQSFHAPNAPPERDMLRQVMPEIPLGDVAAGVRHYCDVLGFHVNYQQHDLGVLDRDHVRVLLTARQPAHRGIACAYFYVEDADALHAELRRTGALIEGPPVSQPWGLRDFSVKDPEGNVLTFGQPFE